MSRLKEKIEKNLLENKMTDMLNKISWNLYHAEYDELSVVKKKKVMEYYNKPEKK